MEIRFANQKDEERIKHIWRYCFTDTESFISLFFKNKYKAQNTLAAYEQGVIVSNLQMLPYKIKLHSNILDTSYIVGAATLPEARGNNCMKHLLESALSVMREKGHLITILLPFNYGFYKKYGWETCYYHNNYNLEISDINAIGARYGKLISYNHSEHFEHIMKIYTDFIKDKNGAIVRSASDWDCILEDYFAEGGKVYVLMDEKGDFVGYILFKISDKTFFIHEMVYANIDVLKGLLGFVSAHQAQADRVIWNAPQNDSTFLLLSDQKGSVTLKPFIMARVVDTLALLEFLCSLALEPASFTIKVTDSFAAYNSGVFRLNNNSVTNESDNFNFDLSCSINTLAQMSMGFLSPDKCYELGLLWAESQAAVLESEKIFKTTDNYINDYY